MRHWKLKPVEATLVRVGPTDTLILSVDAPLDAEQAQRLSELFAARTGIPCERIVVGRGLTLTVITEPLESLPEPTFDNGPVK